MTTDRKKKAFDQPRPPDATSEAIDMLGEDKRSDQRIRELKAQREEILRQVQEQISVESKLLHPSINLATVHSLKWF